MLEIFTPYLPFIAFFITIVINLYLIIKVKVNWIMLLIANLLVTLLMNYVGLGEYDLITQIIDFIVDIVSKIFKGIKDVIGGWIKDLFSWW
jgi:hypothetical protein